MHFLVCNFVPVAPSQSGLGGRCAVGLGPQNATCTGRTSKETTDMDMTCCNKAGIPLTLLNQAELPNLRTSSLQHGSSGFMI